MHYGDFSTRNDLYAKFFAQAVGGYQYVKVRVRGFMAFLGWCAADGGCDGVIGDADVSVERDRPL